MEFPPVVFEEKKVWLIVPKAFPDDTIPDLRLATTQISETKEDGQEHPQQAIVYSEDATFAIEQNQANGEKTWLVQAEITVVKGDCIGKGKK